jgi:hypothetical protein
MPWQEQIACYRARAAEYEVTSYRDVHGAGPLSVHHEA